jgi:imidazolonepropionase-like amidohydrolase
MLAEEAIRGGYDEINHVNFLFLNFLADHETRTNTPLRFSIVAEKAGGLDLSSKPVKDFIALMKQKKTTVDPTLGVFEAMYLSRLGQMSPTVLPFASRLPASVRRTFLLGGLPVPEGQDQTWKDAFAATEKMVKLLHDSGIPIGSGTDSFGGLMLHRELELYVQAGLSTADAIETSTLGAARIMRKDKTTGSIAVGKDADLVLVDGDPLIRMEDIRRVVSTVRGGVVFPSGELYETVGVAPWK